MTIQPDMIGIVVRDMAEALCFYRLLGLDIPSDVESEPHVEIITANGYRIAWDTEELAKSLFPGWPQPIGQRMSLAFKCDNPTEVDALYDRITQAGYQGHKPPWDAFWGQRYAVVADPDGTLLDLFAPL
ncbi:MAG: VOC family protein [Ardenticatenales bacterium]|nr:VOC family protein [Ardenticatenales bacterium]